MLITFEGIDGCGKTTQAEFLAERLRSEGKEVLPLREPGGTMLSEKIRIMLLEKNAAYPVSAVSEFFLFAASRAQLVQEIIKPALDRNDVVILDRFIDSTIAYQGFGRNIELTLIESVNHAATSGIDPDITFFLDLPLELAKLRRKNSANDRIESENNDFHNKVIEGYRFCAKEFKRIHTIDGAASVQEIHTKIWDIVEEKMK